MSPWAPGPCLGTVYQEPPWPHLHGHLPWRQKTQVGGLGRGSPCEEEGLQGSGFQLLEEGKGPRMARP